VEEELRAPTFYEGIRRQPSLRTVKPGLLLVTSMLLWALILPSLKLRIPSKLAESHLKQLMSTESDVEMVIKPWTEKTQRNITFERKGKISTTLMQTSTKHL
jgi:hypothetical protein